MVATISDGTPAKYSDLRELDVITKITAKENCDQNCTVDFSQLGAPYDKEDLFKATTERFKGTTISVEFIRKGETTVRTTDIALRSQEQIDEIKTYNETATEENQKPSGYLGIVPMQYAVTRTPILQSLEVSIGVTQQMIALTFDGLGNIVKGLSEGDTKKATENVSGPVGVFFILQAGSELGIGYILMIIAVISLTLALMNVLPIPALDGGRLFVILLFHGLSKLRQKFQGKPLHLKQATEDWIHGTGFVLMMVLFVLITFVDVKRFF